jgi:hypothetical protein
MAPALSCPGGVHVIMVLPQWVDDHVWMMREAGGVLDELAALQKASNETPALEVGVVRYDHLGNNGVTLELTEDIESARGHIQARPVSDCTEAESSGCACIAIIQALRLAAPHAVDLAAGARGNAASATGGAAPATGGAASATGMAASATGLAASATGLAASATGGAVSAAGIAASATGGAECDIVVLFAEGGTHQCGGYPMAPYSEWTVLGGEELRQIGPILVGCPSELTENCTAPREIANHDGLYFEPPSLGQMQSALRDRLGNPAAQTGDP